MKHRPRLVVVVFDFVDDAVEFTRKKTFRDDAFRRITTPVTGTVFMFVE